MISILRDQASRHEAVLARCESEKIDMEEQLKTHIEALLFRLFPEGPYRRERANLRFGSKGSLSIVCSGDKAGQFYDFEGGEGGGALKLIQRELGLGRSEAKEWARQFLGMAHEIKAPWIFVKAGRAAKEQYSDWVSLKPDSNFPAPTFENISHKKLHHYFEEVARHAYRDESGNLLYYVLRLKDRNDPTKKITPPLSFGYWKSRPENRCWELKGFKMEKNYLYHLPELKEKPDAVILVVEGEKTADKALEKFPGKELVAVTWPGGAGAAQSADWTPLANRKVIIWPDNDKAGSKAAESICRELRKAGVSSLSLVDPAQLQRHFPEKWDLADELPKHMDAALLQDLLNSSLQKGIDPQQLLYRLSSCEQDQESKVRANEILWRVDERLRPMLEKEHGGKTWKVNEEILSETTKLLLKFEDEKKQGDVFERRLAWQMVIHQASHGKDPAKNEMDKMRNVIAQQRSLINNHSDLAIDRVLTKACKNALLGRDLHKKEIQQEVQTTLSLAIGHKGLERNSEKELQQTKNNDGLSL